MRAENDLRLTAASGEARQWCERQSRNGWTGERNRRWEMGRQDRERDCIRRHAIEIVRVIQSHSLPLPPAAFNFFLVPHKRVASNRNDEDSTAQREFIGTINQPVVYISKYPYSKRDKMNYLDDMIELVEDLPEEFQKRFSEIRRLDELVEEMGKECKVMAEELFNSPTTTKERKEQLILELADKRRAMHLLAERKVSIAERSERLMLKIFEKVQESAYHCKIELEVDNPGVSEQIEQRFCQTLDLRPSNSRLYDGILEFESIHNGNDSDSETVSIASEAASVASTSRSILKERTNKSRDNFLSAANKNKKHKKKDKKKKKSTDLSYYMRKKQKLMQDEVGGRKMTVGDAMPSSLGMKLDGGNGIIYEGESDDGDEGTGQRQKKELMTDTNSALGSERGADEQDDLEDLDVFNLFPNNLPSPPREIMESLKEEMPFDVDGSDSGFMPGHSSHSSSSLSALGQFPLRRTGGGDFYPDFNGDFAPDSPRLAKLQLPQMNSASRKNNTKLSFGNANDTSFHGRVRKLTDKAVESMEFHEREKGSAASVNRKKEEWCLCRESIEDDMILCDNKKCPVKWYHLSCVGIEVAPEGEWYCPDCLSTGNAFSN